MTAIAPHGARNRAAETQEVASPRQPRRIVLVTVVLELLTPGGVSAPEQRNAPEGVHLPLARSPLGSGADALYLPASSLAGSLRAHLRTTAPEAFAALMGSEPDEGRGVPSAKLTPSAVRFCGTRVEPAGDRTVLRVRTAIDRDRAAAAATTLHTGEFLPPGSRITAFLWLDRADLRDDLLAALRTWAPTVGRGRTSGHGRTRMVGLRHRTIDLDTREGRRAWLTGGGPELFTGGPGEEVRLSASDEPDPLLRRDFDIVDGLHVGTGSRKSAGEEGPRVALLARDHEGNPYVPGSTWKGVLRSRCEFVLRSLGARACAPTGPACGTCLVCRGFGFTGQGEDSPSRRGLLAFDDSPVRGGEVVTQAHAPADRVFGGVRDGLLFTQEVVRSGRLTLTVRPAAPRPVADSVADPASEALVALFVLACHDVHHGLVGVGGSVTRGLGTLRLVGDPDGLAAERAEAVTTLAGYLARHPADPGGPADRVDPSAPGSAGESIQEER